MAFSDDSSYDPKDLQQEGDGAFLRTEEWAEIERFERGEIDRWGVEVDGDTDPADLYQEREGGLYELGEDGNWVNAD